MTYNSRHQQNPMYPTQSPSPSPLNYSYSHEQEIRAGFQSERIGGLSHFERVRGPSDMREEILRELEKERIREEIIAAEIARRRVLEEEVRRELMIEREMMAMRTSERGFSAPFMAFPPPMNQYDRFEPRIPFHQPIRGDGISFEERVALSMEEKYGGGHIENVGFEVTPFQRLRESSMTKEIRPVEGKQEVFILATPNRETLSGSKRKTATPSAEGPSELRPESSKKKPKEEWSCAVCQVSVNNERGLNEHLGGKKHRAKEAALRAQRTGANLGLGISPKKPTTTKPVELALTTTIKPSSSEKQVKDKKKLVKSTPLATDNSGTKSNKEEETESQNRSEKFKFWCEMCQVGAPSEKVMNCHKKGKKHLTRLLAHHQKGAFGPPPVNGGQTEMVQESDEKSAAGMKNAEEVEKAANAEANVGGEEDGVVVKKADGFAEEENKVKDKKKLVESTPLAIDNSGTESKKEEKTESQNGSEKFKFWCEMCKVGASSEKVMNSHKKGKKHLTRLLALHQRGALGPPPVDGGQTEMVQESDEKSAAGTKKADGFAEEENKVKAEVGTDVQVSEDIYIILPSLL